VPLAIPGLRLLQRWREGKSFVKSYVRSTMLTHDREQARQYDADPLIARSIAVNVLLDLHDTSSRLIDDAGAIRLPTLILAAGKSDWVVRLDAQQKFFERLSSPVKRMQVFDGLHHDILHEVERQKVLAAIRGFCDEMYEQPPVTTPLVMQTRQWISRDRNLTASAGRCLRCLPSVGHSRPSASCCAQPAGFATGFASGGTLASIRASRSTTCTRIARAAAC
jgi:hypothetical protein